MAETIYIVGGTTATYSDRLEWFVCAYRSKEMAEEHVSKAMHRAKEIQNGKGRYDRPKPGENEFDPLMQMDYTGTEYWSAEVKLRDELPVAPDSERVGEIEDAMIAHLKLKFIGKYWKIACVCNLAKLLGLETEFYTGGSGRGD